VRPAILARRSPPRTWSSWTSVWLRDKPGDPFRTAKLRGRVLDAWAASPARFHEDAEEDYALGGYRDRGVVELAQNAADAAVRAGGCRAGCG
jgi:hypothetical protein